jgi:hypothetical protein
LFIFNSIQSVIIHFFTGILSITVLMLIPVLTFGQNTNDQLTYSSQGPYQVIKTNHSERFVLPFTSSNSERLNPLVYIYAEPKGPSWILTIQNNLSYNSGQDAKTIIKLQEPAPSEKFIDVAMYNDDSSSKRFWVSANTKEVGYVRLYDKKGNFGWSRNQPITISYATNQGLTISSGTRVYVDRLSTNGFTLGSISVYGKDNPKSPLNTYAGDIYFNVIYGDPASSQIYYLPLVTLVGMGGIVSGLLILKRRKAT